MHRFTSEAMATTFEIVIADETDAAYARSAATAVFADIDKLESDLSRFRPDSDLARIRSLPNNAAGVGLPRPPRRPAARPRRRARPGA